MRILIFYQYFGTPKGSWSTRIYEFCKRWVEKGNQVTVVTAPYEKSDIKVTSFIERLNIEGIDVIVINSADSNRNGTLKRMFRAVVFATLSVYYALSLPADVVITSSGPITVGIPGLFSKWFRRRKLVFEVRDLWPQGAIQLNKIRSKLVIRIGLFFEKLCYRNSNLVVACSKGMEEGVRKVCPECKTLVIPNASDPELFLGKSDEFKLPAEMEGKSVFLYTGSLGLMDDCTQIINGMSLVKDQSIALVFIGDGAERNKLELEARESGNGNIYFTGLIPKTEVVKWLSIATASFVTFRDIPVLHTSSPNKMFDSFAAGVPVIQSTRGWIKELIDKENCGINVDPASPQDFAHAMLDISTNKARRETMAANAKRLAENDFNRTRLAYKYLDAMQNLG